MQVPEVQCVPEILSIWEENDSYSVISPMFKTISGLRASQIRPTLDRIARALRSPAVGDIIYQGKLSGGRWWVQDVFVPRVVIATYEG